MSAYLVNKAHIDALVTAGVENRPHRGESFLSWYIDLGQTTNPHRRELSHENVDDVGSMLWTENLRSVSHRYPDDVDGDRPGPIDLQDEEIVAYAYERLPHSHNLEPLVIIAAIKGYEYQSCEHPGWETSEAKAFCEALHDRMIHRLPGIDDAMSRGWSIDRDVFAPPTRGSVRRSA